MNEDHSHPEPETRALHGAASKSDYLKDADPKSSPIPGQASTATPGQASSPIPGQAPTATPETPETQEHARISRRRLLQAGVAAAGAAAVGPIPSIRRLLPGQPGRSGPSRLSSSRSPVDQAGNPAPATDVPPPQQLQAITVAPPGQSGFFSLEGEALGKLTGKPGSYGANVDNQRLLYWTFGYKPGNFAKPTGQPEQPTTGARLYRDAYGVPVIYGDSAFDVWFAAGWAFAQDRLFEMDAIRRLATGRLAELTGPSAVPGDVQARVLGYTSSEYETMFSELLTKQDQLAVDGCVSGINAWIDKVLSDPLQLLPAEYALLSSLPERWERVDVLASAVLIVLSVASAGGNEMQNVANLVALEQAFPEVSTARGIFQDLFWLEDAKAVTTVPQSSGRFPNSLQSPSEQRAAFEAMADYATSLPSSLANGPGTGAFPAPGNLGPVSSASSAPMAAGFEPASLPGVPGGLGALNARLPEAARAGVSRAVAALQAWGRALHGGSYQVAISPKRSATGTAMLISGPQLGYSYPSELYEIEVHGGGYNARGATVPGLPVVGIGYGTRIAWALTTGESKTIDSFIETTRPNPNGGPPQYLFNGRWLDQECRTETVRYRLAPGGVPVGPPAESVSVEVCRTHHGPIVATAQSSTGGLARSWAFAIRYRELQTMSGILQWNRAQNLEEFAAGMERVTWNENTMYADADGNIAYWHPGLYPVRSKKVDLRFPTPGTGGYEWEGMIPTNEMPHAINPAQGYLANWNTKPSVAWLEEAGAAPGQPAGAVQRVQDITSMIANRNDLTFSDLAAIDRYIGITDHRARSLVPLVMDLRRTKGLSAEERAALSLLASWDYAAYDPPAGVEMGVSTTTTDGPAPTIFSELVVALRSELFGFLPAQVVAADDQPSIHLFDIKPIDNLALRILEPASSSLRPSYDYLSGRSRTEVLKASLGRALQVLAERFNTNDMLSWRRPHPTSSVCSLTGGVIGPCLAMPFEDRGTYIHHVVFS